MWRLLRDHFARETWGILGAAGAATFPVFLILTLLAMQRAAIGAHSPAMLFVGAVMANVMVCLLYAALVGSTNLLTVNPGAIRFLRTLPLPAPVLARALWLVAVSTGVAVGLLTTAFLAVFLVVLGARLQVPIAGAGTLALVVLSFLWWSLVGALVALGPLGASGRRRKVWALVLYPLFGAPWLWLVSQHTLAVSLLGGVAGVAALSAALAPRLMAAQTRHRRSEEAASLAPRGSVRMGRRSTGWLPGPALIGILAAAMAAGFGMAYVGTDGGRTAHIDDPLAWLVALWAAQLWIPVWTPHPRALRSLPVTAGQLAAVPVGGYVSLYLATALGGLTFDLSQSSGHELLPIVAFVGFVCPGAAMLASSMGYGEHRSWRLLPGLVLLWVFAGLFASVVARFGPTAAVSMALIVGPGLTTIGWLFVRRTIMRNGKLYRPAPLETC